MLKPCWNLVLDFVRRPTNWLRFNGFIAQRMKLFFPDSVDDDDDDDDDHN